MEKLTSLKAQLDAGQLSEGEYLKQRNSFISSASAPNAEAILAAAANLKRVVEDDLDPLVKDPSMAQPLQILSCGRLCWKALLTLWNCFTESWDVVDLFARVCNKARVFQIGALPYVARIMGAHILQAQVRRLAIDFLWNFGELGAIDAIMETFRGGPPEISVESIGLLWCLLEFGEIQELVITKGLLPMMFDFVDAFVSARFPQQSAIKIDERVRRLALSIDAVNSVSLAGCIHLISCNENCVQEMLSYVERYLIMSNVDEVMLSYFHVLTLANLIEARLINVESDLGRRTLVAISGFLGRFTVKQLIDEEVKGFYAWCSMKPFTNLLSTRHREIYELAFMALANLMDRQANRGIVADEGNEGLVIVHAYFPRSRSPSIDEACQSILKNMAPKKPPSLAAIAQIKLLPPIV